jgi:hypothetical protein
MERIKNLPLLFEIIGNALICPSFFARSSQVISANLLVMNRFEYVFIVGIFNL